MSGLLGAMAPFGSPPPDLRRAAARLVQHEDERTGSATSGSAAITVTALPSKPARERVWTGDGVLVALYGTAYWADAEASSACGTSPREDSGSAPGNRITAPDRARDRLVAGSTGRSCEGVLLPLAELAAAYLQQGAAMLERLGGAFALAIAVERAGRREVLLATDRLGIEAMCFALHGSGLAFGTRADAVAAYCGAADIDPQALYDYLYFHMVPAPRTVFRDVRRLLPGTCALWRDGTVALHSYWQPRFDESDTTGFAALAAEFKDSLRAGVRRAAAGATDAIGCFLSGGTDSSTVSGLLGPLLGRPAPTFSIGFEAQGYDEMAYARIAARHFATLQREYYVTPADVADSVERIAAAHDQPFGNASVLPAYYCAKLARGHGIARLLAGDGGDELYGGNERYATQALFSLYGRLPAALRGGLLEPLLGVLPAAGALRKAKGYVRQAKVPLPDRLQTYNLLERIGLGAVLHPDLLAAIDREEPLHLLRESYDGALAATQINRLLALDLRFTLADSDLPKVNRACELAGVEVAYPLLDPAVVDFSLRLRPEYKLKGRRLRWFFKEALRDVLPREIIDKKKHGFGLPFGVWLRADPRLHALAGDTLAGLRRRRIVNDALLDELMSSKLGEHAGYYGTLVWVLMTLELWLARPAVEAAAAPAAAEPLAAGGIAR